MIKEQEKSTKYNYKKSIKTLIYEYLRTVFFSVIFASILTICLSVHARNEMIKNLYTNVDEQKKIDRQQAELFIQSNTNLIKDIKNKKYSVCIHIGELYETVGDNNNAQIAYESAVEKSKPGEYTAYYKLLCVLVNQEKFTLADELLSGIKDYPNKKLIKFKTRSYIVIGDKYYSIGKFLSAAKNYEKAEFYYNKFKKRDRVIEDSIKKRVINSYLKAADEIVGMGYNSEAVRYLKKVEKLCPDNLKIKYKLGIILSDSDPEQSIKYFEPLLDKIPQDIDYGVFCTALMKAANIADLDGRQTKAKYYRNKIHSIDLFIKRKVIYKNDLDISLDSFTIKKLFFKYPLKCTYKFVNTSNTDINYLKADFVLCQSDKPLETITKTIAERNAKLEIGGYDAQKVSIKFKKSIFTKRELKNYTIKIYAYKDDKFKTLVSENKIPMKTILPEK